MALAPLTGRQIFETGIEADWIAHDTARLRARAYADWPVNALDEADLPAKQHQMTFEHALIQIEPQGERRTRVSYELQTPAWIYMLITAIMFLMGWAAWLSWRTLGPETRLDKVTLALTAVLMTVALSSSVSILRLQSIALMDSVVRTFGSTVAKDG